MQIRLTTASERYYLNTKLMTDILNMYTGLFFFFLNRWWGSYTSKDIHFKI